MENSSYTSMTSALEEERWYDNSTLDSHEEIVVYKYDYEVQLLAAILIIGAILGVFGNSFVIVAVGMSRKLRTTTNVFVVNLAVADTLTSLFSTVQAVAILGRSEWPIPQAEWLCTLTSFVDVVTYGSSSINLALIAINRWVGITKSRLTASRVYTTRKLALMVIFSWGMPLCCALTPVLTDFGELGYEKLYSTCTWDRSNPYSFYYNILFSAMCYPVQLIAVTICYSSIFRYVRETSRKMARVDVPSVSGKANDRGANDAMKKKLWKRQVDVTKNLLFVFLSFLLCLTPFFVAIVSSADWSYRLTPWAGSILFFNSCINPFIYATSHPDFKEAFSYMIRCQKVPNDRRSQRNTSAAVNASRV